MTLNLSRMNLTIFLSNFARSTLDSQRVFMVEEGKIVQNKENSTPSVLQLNDTKVMSHNSDVIQNLFQQLLHSNPVWFTTLNEENQLMNGNEIIYKAQNGTYIEKNTDTNQPFNANTRTDAVCTVGSWTHRLCNSVQGTENSERQWTREKDWEKGLVWRMKRTNYSKTVMFVNRLDFSLLIGQSDASCELCVTLKL